MFTIAGIVFAFVLGDLVKNSDDLNRKCSKHDVICDKCNDNFAFTYSTSSYDEDYCRHYFCYPCKICSGDIRGEYSEKEAIDVLRRGLLDRIRNKSGSFLVRTNENKLFLSLQMPKEIKHFEIMNQDNQVSIDQTTYFDSLDLLISHYKSNPVINNTKLVDRKEELVERKEELVEQRLFK